MTKVLAAAIAACALAVPAAHAQPVCDVLIIVSNLVPNVPPVYEIRNDGDLYVAGQHVVDCPPYGR